MEAPRKPPTTAPSPSRSTISQSISASIPNRSSSDDDDEDQAGDGVDGRSQHVLRAVEALQGLVDPDAEHRHQQDALRRSEVAAVDAGQEDRRPHPPGAVPRRRARRPPRGPPPGRPPPSDSRGCRITSTTPSRIRPGTMASNASGGSTSSSPAPIRPPTTEATSSRLIRAPLPLELAPVADGARDRARHQADVVADVGRHRRHADGEQGREGDEGARPDDGVDRACPDTGQEDGGDLERRQVSRDGGGDGLRSGRRAARAPAACRTSPTAPRR